MGAYDGPDDLGRQLRDVERRLSALESAPRLTKSSMFGGALSIIDPVTSDEVVRLGLQDDGSYGLNVVAGRLTVAAATVDAVSADAANTSMLNVALTTTPTAHMSVVLTRPTWATKALVFASSTTQMTQTTGADQSLLCRVDIDGTPGSGGITQVVLTSDTGHVNDTRARVITGLSSNVTVTGNVWVGSGTNAANLGTLTAFAVFLRA